jgi:hypothetical protein
MSQKLSLSQLELYFSTSSSQFKKENIYELLNQQQTINTCIKERDVSTMVGKLRLAEGWISSKSRTAGLV